MIATALASIVGSMEARQELLMGLPKEVREKLIEEDIKLHKEMRKKYAPKETTHPLFAGLIGFIIGGLF